MSQPKIVFTYFPIAARGEGIRLLLEYTETPHEYHELSFEEHGARKAEWPLGQVPILEVDGQKICQTGAILQYIAKINNMGPADPLQAAICQSVFDAVNESAMVSVMPAVNMHDDEKCRASAVAYREAAPKYLKFFTTTLGEKSFFHGDTPGYADFYLFTQLELGIQLAPALLADSPALESWMKRVGALDAVAKYIKNRGPLKDRSDAIKGL